jgi:zinc protease
MIRHFEIRRRTWIGAAVLLATAGALHAADELPKAETILDKFVEVTGGKAAYAKVHSEVTTGTMEMAAMGLKGSLVAYTAEPDKHLVEITFEGIGKIQEGSDGQTAWSLSAIQGPRLKEGDEKAEALEQGRFHSDARWRDIYQKVETIGLEPVDGKDCYKVSLTRKTGTPQTRWFDKQTNLLVKVAATVKSPMGEISSESVFSDYRKEGDLLVAHKAKLSAAGQEIVMTIDKVQQNAEIPKDKFEMPAEIKALMKK